jgi:hypothetical protein
MNERQSPDKQRACCGIGLGWGRLFWILLGVLGMAAAVAALPSMLESALAKAGVF